MGLLQNAIQTYELLESKGEAGRYEEGKEPLAPIGHKIAKADIEVTIDVGGNYHSSSVVPQEQCKVIIPVTEASAGRGAGLAPHPLCEQVKYLGIYDKKSEEAFYAYIKQLSEWVDSEYTDVKLEAILRFVSGNTLLEKLQDDGTIKLNDKGKPAPDNALVVWRVLGSGGSDERTYKDTDLMNKYSLYYQSQLEREPKGVCMLTGVEDPLATQHLKGVFSLDGNAKIISANDKTNFTYRGRFTDAEQALTISYNASQKAHNALKYLIANQAVIYAGRAFLCWSPQGNEIPQPEHSLMTFQFGSQPPVFKTLSDYRDQLQKWIGGYKSGINNINFSKTAIASFDAATTGRLAVTAYSEQLTTVYLDRLKTWDEHCCWYYSNFLSEQVQDSVSSPALYKIALCTFGLERDRDNNGKLDMDDNIGKQAMERLLYCRIGQQTFPEDMERRLVENASHLALYGRNTGRDVINTACAVVRLYHFQRRREELSMDLEKGKEDRSYQFGRLLAAYEKLERDAWSSSGNQNNSGKRETNAIRLQSVFCNRPMHYAFELDKQMEKAYFPRLPHGTAVFYKNLIGEIMANINSFPQEEWDQPLKDTYLMGYYLQRKDLYTKKEAKTGE